MYDAEKRARMNELFRQKLAAERNEEPTRDTAQVDTGDLREAFPDLAVDTAAGLAQIELVHNPNWILTETQRRSGEGRLMGLWFTDEAGARRLGLVDKTRVSEKAYSR